MKKSLGLQKTDKLIYERIRRLHVKQAAQRKEEELKIFGPPLYVSSLAGDFEISIKRWRKTK